MVSWKEQQEIIEDAKQMFLNPDMSITTNQYVFAKKGLDMKFNEIVLCPFCLKSYPLEKFKLEKGLRVCPNCTTKMMLSTLGIRDLDKFVKFVFDYRFNGFWSKICLDIPEIDHNTRFNEWTKRLWDLGIALEFWVKYKNLKGDYEKNEE